MKVNVTTSKRHVSIKEETKYSTRLLSGWRLFFGGQNVSSLSTKQKLQTNCESCVCPHSSATLLVAIGSLCCFRLWSSTTRFFDVDSNPLSPSLPPPLSPVPSKEQNHNRNAAMRQLSNNEHAAGRVLAMLQCILLYKRASFTS